MKKYKKRVLKRTINSIVTALSILIAIAWNGVVSNLCERILKKWLGLTSQFIYAILVTVIAVFVIMKIEKMIK